VAGFQDSIFQIQDSRASSSPPLERFNGDKKDLLTDIRLAEKRDAYKASTGAELDALHRLSLDAERETEARAQAATCLHEQADSEKSQAEANLKLIAKLDEASKVLGSPVKLPDVYTAVDMARDLGGEVAAGDTLSAEAADFFGKFKALKENEEVGLKVGLNNASDGTGLKESTKAGGRRRLEVVDDDSDDDSEEEEEEEEEEAPILRPRVTKKEHREVVEEEEEVPEVILPRGSRIVVKELIGRRDLNGMRGRVLGWLPSKGRYRVELQGGATHALKPRNCTHVPKTVSSKRIQASREEAGIGRMIDGAEVSINP